MIAPMAYRHTIERYTRGWALGTGLPVSLKPGEYVITGRRDVNGTLYFVLNDAFRVAATSFERTVRNRTNLIPSISAAEK